MCIYYLSLTFEVFVFKYISSPELSSVCLRSLHQNYVRPNSNNLISMTLNST
jgi:hypothetical protein